ncbi:hypothetical protein BC939DRAFT_66396 [Gamsiella multidivaricata]|uniref:uncharacterized protein n=1 Tax=Gamsiella multidivaricata TaxID=101098 RepID=UPI00221F14EA|nr:uncharacterized protein BC939DRAFT_66396 [Gamsiella multidivaricata]KAI7816032.1 hypothetical protein BC939DRAFT_66396 [Gamsiella multidivaricata]
MRTNTLKSLSGVLALALMSTATSADNAQSNLDECRVLKEASDLCPSAQYKSNVKNVPDVNSRIQEHFENIPSTLDGLDVQCGHALQKALRLLEFPKYKGHSPEALPVCWSVRNSVSRACYDPFKYLCATSDHHRGDSEAALQAEIRDSLFMPLLNSRWASSPYIQEPDCVSFQDRDLKSMPGDNIKAIDDLEDSSLSQAEGREKEDNWLKEQSVAELNGDQGGLFDFLTDNDSLPQAKGYQQQMAEATLKAKHLSRRDRVKHHHHHHQHQQRHHHHEQKRSTEQISGAKEPQPQSEDHHPLQVADVVPGQTIYAVHQVEGSTGGAGGNELLHESLSHAETNKENGEQAKGQQRILIQGGSGPVDPAGATGSLGKASAGQSDPKNLTDATITESQDGTGSPHKDPLMLAAIPILLLMGAIVGFTVYRRFYENSQGGDVQDEYSSDGYHRRGNGVARRAIKQDELE